MRYRLSDGAAIVPKMRSDLTYMTWIAARGHVRSVLAGWTDSGMELSKVIDGER